MAEVKKEEKKGPLGKLKEVAEDKEEQLQYLATLIRVIVLVWSAGILTLNYVKIPGYEPVSYTHLTLPTTPYV